MKARIWTGGDDYRCFLRCVSIRIVHDAWKAFALLLLLHLAERICSSWDLRREIWSVLKNLRGLAKRIPGWGWAMMKIGSWSGGLEAYKWRYSTAEKQGAASALYVWNQVDSSELLVPGHLLYALVSGGCDGQAWISCFRLPKKMIRSSAEKSIGSNK